MTLTPKMIDEMRLHGRTPIDENLEALLLQHYGTEPFPYTYTEQDLYEQTRKFIALYNHDHAVASTKRSEPGVTRLSASTEKAGGQRTETRT